MDSSETETEPSFKRQRTSGNESETSGQSSAGDNEGGAGRGEVESAEAGEGSEVGQGEGAINFEELPQGDQAEVMVEELGSDFEEDSDFLGDFTRGFARTGEDASDADPALSEVGADLPEAVDAAEAAEAAEAVETASEFGEVVEVLSEVALAFL